MADRRSVRHAAASIVALIMAVVSLAAGAQPVPDVCKILPNISGAGFVAGNTNGQFGTLAAGESVTMTATLGTATSGTFRIVGDPGGVNTLAGPTGIPGSLTFTSNGTLPGSSVGVGWFVDTAVGGTVNINVTSFCLNAVPVPTTSTNTLIILAALLALGGAIVLVRRAG